MRVVVGGGSWHPWVEPRAFKLEAENLRVRAIGNVLGVEILAVVKALLEVEQGFEDLHGRHPATIIGDGLSDIFQGALTGGSDAVMAAGRLPVVIGFLGLFVGVREVHGDGVRGLNMTVWPAMTRDSVSPAPMTLASQMAQ